MMQSIAAHGLTQVGSHFGRLVAPEAWVVAYEKLALEPVRVEQNISRNSFSFYLQEFPQPVHCLSYAFVCLVSFCNESLWKLIRVCKRRMPPSNRKAL